MAPVAYDLAVASWRQSPVICIVTVTGKAIAYFPLEFVKRGGHPEWLYIVLALEQITRHAAEEQWWLQCSNGNPVPLPECPSAGTYVYRCQGTWELQNNVHSNADLADENLEPVFVRGPEYFKRFQAPTPGGSVSTRSDSKRSSARQVSP